MANQETAPTPRRESLGVRFKPAAPSVRRESPNPALERYKLPQPPSPARCLLPVLRGLAVALAIVVVFLALLWFAPLGDVKAQADLESARRALRTAADNLDQYQPVWEIREAAVRSRATAEPDTVAALFAAAALGELHNGDEKRGSDQCGYGLSTYRGRPAAARVVLDSLMETCPGCKGSGKVGASSPGSLSASCPRCRGSGKVLSPSTVRTEYARALDEALAAVRSGGSGVLGLLRRTQSNLHRLARAHLPVPPALPPLTSATTNSPANGQSVSRHPQR
jgi:hypothetical protein